LAFYVRAFIRAILFGLGLFRFRSAGGPPIPNWNVAAIAKSVVERQTRKRAREFGRASVNNAQVLTFPQSILKILGLARCANPSSGLTGTPAKFERFTREDRRRRLPKDAIVKGGLLTFPAFL